MKRLIFILIVLAVIGAAVGIGFLLRERGEGPVGSPPPAGTLPLPSGPITGTGTATGTAAGAEGPPAAPTAPEATLTRVLEGETMSFFVGKNGEVTRVAPDGTIAVVPSGGEPATVNATPIAGIRRASFSPDGKNILVSFGDAAARETSVFTVEAKSWTPLATGLENPSWGTEGYSIVYARDDKGKMRLFALDLKKPKSPGRELLSLFAQEFVPKWILPDTILLEERPSAYAKSSLWRFDLKKRTLSPVLLDRRGLEVMWNASGTDGLAFVGGENFRGGQLFLIAADGRVVRRLTFRTLPSKCAFGTKRVSSKGDPGASREDPALYCAVPRDQNALSRYPLPDAYYKKSFFTEDAIYKISLVDGAAEPLFAGETPALDAEGLSVFGEKLYFINRYDGGLYSLAL